MMWQYKMGDDVVNDSERERFWNTICSLDGIDVREDSKNFRKQ